MTHNEVRSGAAVCPDRDELLAFHLGQLPQEMLDALAAHLDACPSCSSLAEQLHADASGSLAELRQALVPSPWSEAEERRAAELVASLGLRPTQPADSLPASSANELPPSRRLGQYELLELLGSGAMGRVFKARHLLMDRIVALKVIHEQRLSQPEFSHRFLREIRALACLDHPNIVRALDADQEAGSHFLVMEYVAGTTLDRVIGEDGPLPVARACDCVMQAALGLQHAFEHGLVHRDVKPANLILTPDGQVKVLDLGLALFFAGRTPTERQTLTGQVLGTAEYMAPEQWEDTSAVDVRADIYSLGCTLYHLLAGRPPFSTPNATVRQLMKAHAESPVPPIRQDRPDVPEGLAAVLERLLAKDAGQRYATPAEVAAALRPFATTGQPLQLTVAGRASSTASAAGARRWQRRGLVVAAAALVALLVGALWWRFLPDSAPPRIIDFHIDHYRYADENTFDRLGVIGINGIGRADVCRGSPGLG
jgi:tRNA A-37 threonylcarbamoyl transferase component Bud32